MAFPSRAPIAGTALALVTALAGCSRPTDPATYFPLAAGLHWQYRVERTTMDGVSEQRHAISTLALSAGAAGYAGARETLGGQRYYYAATDDGILRVAEQTPDASAPRALAAGQIVLPATLAPAAAWKGTTTTAVLESSGPPWETRFRVTVPVEMAFRLESVSDTVDTPAGRFEACLRIAGGGREQADVGNLIGHTTIAVASTEWYAPGVGLVRMERTETTDAEAMNHGRIEMTLDRWWRQ